MTVSFSRVLPRHALGYYLAAFALLYLFAALFLASLHIWLLPGEMISRMMHYRGAPVVMLLALPVSGYLFWLGSDLIAWRSTPLTLTLDAQALHVGARRIAYTAITSLRHQHNRSHLRLTLKSGERIRIRLNLWDAPLVLATELESRIGGSQHAGALHALQAGQTLHFGPVSMSAAGLTCNQRPVPWTSISNIRTQSNSEGLETEETLIIVADGKTHKVDRSKLTNEPVLLACMQHYLPRV